MQAQAARSVPQQARMAMLSCTAAAAEAAGVHSTGSCDPAWFGRALSMLRTAVSCFHHSGNPAQSQEFCIGKHLESWKGSNCT